MVSLTALWLPILLSAALVFLASFLIHMVIGYHAADYGRAGPSLGVSLVVDLVAGAAATALMLRGFDAAGAYVAATLRSGAFLGGTAVVFATGVVPLMVSRLTARAWRSRSGRRGSTRTSG